MPIKGTLVPEKKIEKDYLLKAVYQDKGSNQAPSLSTTQYFLLRWPTLYASQYDDSKFTSRLNDGVIRFTKSGAYLVFSDIDLTDLSEVSYTIAAAATGSLELRMDSPDGALLSEARLEASVSIPSSIFRESRVPIKLASGIHNLYVVYNASNAGKPGVREVSDLVLIGFK